MIRFLPFVLLVHCQSGPFIDKNIDLKNKNSYAVINTESEMTHKVLAGFDERISLIALNDKSLFRLSWGNMYPYEAYVRPGVYIVEYRYNHLAWRASGCLLLKAEPNARYLLKKKVDMESTKIINWIVDMSTNKTVSLNITDKTEQQVSSLSNREGFFGGARNCDKNKENH